MSARKPYPSDLTALQWHNISHLFPQPKTRVGRKRTYDRKGIVDAVFYLARTGCQWRALPHDFPPWKTVSYYFYTWRDAGVWERLAELKVMTTPCEIRPRRCFSTAHLPGLIEVKRGCARSSRC